MSESPPPAGSFLTPHTRPAHSGAVRSRGRSSLPRTHLTWNAHKTAAQRRSPGLLARVTNPHYGRNSYRKRKSALAQLTFGLTNKVIARSPNRIREELTASELPCSGTGGLG
jgi:hypothetical protein